nr:MAG TPA: hypothetical protein [Caudoviricetes sp.]
MNDKNLNAKAPEVRRILPVMLKVENLHIHLDERSIWQVIEEAELVDEYEAWKEANPNA